MEKVYLLLRNNCEMGPYTYEELLQQQLLPTDLIWVEGKSSAWMNPVDFKKNEPVSPSLVQEEKQEINALVAPPIKEEVPWFRKRRSPEAELEAKAIVLREQAEAAATSSHRYKVKQSTSTIKHKPIVFEDEPPVLLEIHRANKKSVTLPQLIAAGVITALLTTGWYNRDKLTLVRPQASLISQAASPVLFQVIPPPAPKAIAIPIVDSGVKEATVTTQVQVTPIKVAVVSNRQQDAPKRETETIPSVTSLQTLPSVEEIKKKEAAVEVNPPVAEKKAVVAEANNDNNASSETISSEPAKKKGLGQALKNIFKKKKKADGDANAE